MAELTWADREGPLLQRAYDLLESGVHPVPTEDLLELGVDRAVVVRTVRRLAEAGYVSVHDVSTMAESDFWVLDLTAAGLRSIGAWPNPADASDVFLSVIDKLIERSADPEEQTRLEKLKSVAGDVSKASLTALVVGAVKGVGGLA
jgi:hypothetical protein